MHLFVGTRSWAWSTVMLDAEMYDIFGMQNFNEYVCFQHLPGNLVC